MSGSLPLEFLIAVPDVTQLPETRAEVAFIGRSNVGKSSLLNAVSGGKKLAFVSKTPGRTQLLTCFGLARTGSTVVDCPGYGYAKVAKTTRAAWLPMIEEYLIEREGLVMVLLLVDGAIGPMDSDLAMLETLRAHDIPHSVIATKLDQVKPSKIEQRRRDLAQACAFPATDVLWVSATHSTGLPRLRELVRGWLA